MKTRLFTAAVLFAIAISSAGAATTANLTLTGTVNGVLDITVAADSNASALDLLTNQSDLQVAVVTEKSNKASGYTVQLETVNGSADSLTTGRLKGTGSNTDSVDYTLKYDGNSVSFTNGVAVITDTTDTTDSDGVSKNLTISYTGDDTLAEDTYSDTLVFTIAAK